MTLTKKAKQERRNPVFVRGKSFMKHFEVVIKFECQGIMRENVRGIMATALYLLVITFNARRMQ